MTSALARAGTATQRLVALTGDSLRLSNGLTHTGALLTRLSTSLDGLTSGSAGMRSLDQVATALNDIPDVVPDNLVAARTAEGRTDAGDGSDSRASEMRPADTTHSVSGNTNSGGGSGTTVLERSDLGDGSIPADRGGSSDLPAGRDGSGDIQAGRSDGTDATPSCRESPTLRAGANYDDRPDGRINEKDPHGGELEPCPGSSFDAGSCTTPPHPTPPHTNCMPYNPRKGTPCSISVCVSFPPNDENGDDVRLRWRSSAAVRVILALTMGV